MRSYLNLDISPGIYAAGEPMRIDIGAGGKIIATKRVSPNGQVSGLREYAGREVLIILPGEGGAGQYYGAEDAYAAIQKMVQAQMEIAFKQYDWMRERFSDPNEAVREFMRGISPPGMRSIMEMMDAWFKKQARP